MSSINASWSLPSISCLELKWPSPSDCSPLTWLHWHLSGGAILPSSLPNLQSWKPVKVLREPKKCLRSPENSRVLIYSLKTNQRSDSTQGQIGKLASLLGCSIGGAGEVLLTEARVASSLKGSCIAEQPTSAQEATPQSCITGAPCPTCRQLQQSLIHQCYITFQGWSLS